MADGREPVALAMVLCDAIHTDPATGKRTLLGLFSSLVTREWPAVVQNMGVYVALTECHGEVPFTLRVTDANEDREPVFESENSIHIADPLGVAELHVQLGGLEFPAGGEYRVQLRTGGHPIIERRLFVLSADQIRPATSPEEPTDG